MSPQSVYENFANAPWAVKYSVIYVLHTSKKCNLATEVLETSRTFGSRSLVRVATTVAGPALTCSTRDPGARTFPEAVTGP